MIHLFCENSWQFWAKKELFMQKSPIIDVQQRSKFTFYNIYSFGKKSYFIFCKLNQKL